MREAMFAVAKIQSHLRYPMPTTVAPVECTLATSCARIFFNCFNTSLSFNDDIFIRLCCQVLSALRKKLNEGHNDPSVKKSKDQTALTGGHNTEAAYMNIQQQPFLYQNNNKDITP